MTSPEQARWLEWRFPGDGPWVDRVRAGRRRYLALCLAIGLVGGAGWTFLLCSVAGSPNSGESTDLPAWREGASWTLLGLGIGSLVVGIVRLSRDGQYGAVATSPLWASSMRQRRAVMRQIRGAEPVEPIDAPFLRDVAAQTAGQSSLSWLCAAMLLTQASGLLRDVVLREALTAAFATAIAGWLLLQAWRARRFLSRYPASDYGKASDAASGNLGPSRR